jgi:hypothetical protein
VSLILTYHNPTFGIVCSDGRVSRRKPDGSHEAVEGESARKFVVLRPGLVLAGSSSVHKWLDYAIFDCVRRYVESVPDASFDAVAGFVALAVPNAEAAFGLSGGRGSRSSESARLRC